MGVDHVDRLADEALGRAYGDPTPIAFDFAWPIRDELGDDTQVISFSIDRPNNSTPPVVIAWPPKVKGCSTRP